MRALGYTGELLEQQNLARTHARMHTHTHTHASGREEGPTQQQLDTVSMYVRAYARIVKICTPFLIKFASKDLSG